MTLKWMRNLFVFPTMSNNSFAKDKAIAELLELDLKCPHCNAVLESAEERKQQQAKEHGNKK